MSQSTTDPTDLSLFESFMNFPAPLVLTDVSGRPQLVNRQFTKHYGDATFDASEVIAKPDMKEVLLCMRGGSADGVSAKVKITQTSKSILIVFKGFLDSDDDNLGVWLQDRIAELEKLAATDHLTGVWNRAHLDRVIGVELARSIATLQPISLVLFDVDHFKRINDEFGHPVGDSVLCELADRVRAHLRSADMLFRWGGEEFVVLVSSGGYRSAEHVAEKLRRAVEERPFKTAGRVTISSGVAEHAGRETTQDWFKRLDTGLYQAKNGGRNCVVVDRLGNSDAWAMKPGALFLVWKEGYECGDPVIDGEHRELFDLANVLIDKAAQHYLDPAGFRSALDNLLAHIAQHFAHEEEILAKRDYSGLEQHKRAHAGLLERARKLKTQIEQGSAGFGAIVEYLAQDVVARHLLAVDRAFFPLFTPSGGTLEKR